MPRQGDGAGLGRCRAAGSAIALLSAMRDGRLVARPSFFQLLQVRKARTLGVPMHLIAHEDVLVLANGWAPVRSAQVDGAR